MTQRLIDIVKESIYFASLGISQLSEEIYYLNGMFSPKVRRLLNQICGLSGFGASYLEVGSWRGSTVISATYGNQIASTCIDDFSQFNSANRFCVNPLIYSLDKQMQDMLVPECAPKQELMNRIQQFAPSIKFIEGDFHLPSTLSQISENSIDIYLYDGEYSYQNQYDGIKCLFPHMKDSFILCVDDWTMDANSEVRTGTYNALQDLKATIKYEWNGYSNGNGDIENWWNGFFVGVISK